uniref:Uncharacterized protein n=1 Tax=uncultured Thiotrichaceae bacterium TaxID=298394 RepID=A0A6S6SK60_9GAMM|nr:MAG: FIG00560454: hypothetical protein [uncultured Thiotrichaceae bacterium]
MLALSPGGMVILCSLVFYFEPKVHAVTEDKVPITTEPGTDFWQRSYYGFRNDNAPALLLKSDDNFTFTTRVDFNYSCRFDQCGVIIYLDSENWFKASIEFGICSNHENPVNGSLLLLGSLSRHTFHQRLQLSLLFLT